LGRRLSDQQMLDLADRYHELIRTRQCVRAALQRRERPSEPAAFDERRTEHEPERVERGGEGWIRV
jgi:hypothetical protein